MEALAATAMLRQHFPDLKLRFVNVVDLFRLVRTLPTFCLKLLKNADII
jgi:phosphoketolase